MSTDNLDTLPQSNSTAEVVTKPYYTQLVVPMTDIEGEMSGFDLSQGPTFDTLEAAVAHADSQFGCSVFFGGQKVHEGPSAPATDADADDGDAQTFTSITAEGQIVVAPLEQAIGAAGAADAFAPGMGPAGHLEDLEDRLNDALTILAFIRKLLPATTAA